VRCLAELRTRGRVPDRGSAVTCDTSAWRLRDTDTRRVVSRIEYRTDDNRWRILDGTARVGVNPTFTRERISRLYREGLLPEYRTHGWIMNRSPEITVRPSSRRQAWADSRRVVLRVENWSYDNRRRVLNWTTGIAIGASSTRER